jgi:hypothetical protein
MASPNALIVRRLIRHLRERKPSTKQKRKAMDDDSDDFTKLDDNALLSRRAEMRAELERLSPTSSGYAALRAIYDKSTAEVNDRARKAWSGAR